MNSKASKRQSTIWTVVDELMPELWSLALFIHEHPELSGKEYEAQKCLVGFLEEKGFTCQTGVAGIETAFVCWSGKPRKPAVGIIAEYDALPELGHACGHNMIAASAVGAVVAFMAARSDCAGQVYVIGTPAEETVKFHVKQTMLDAGVFHDFDVALMMHGSDRTTTMGRNLAVDSVEFHFVGNPTHASKYPHLGASALDAAVLAMTALEFLREHVRSDVRIHGIVTDGGLRPNIVPEKAGLEYMVRSETRSYLNEIKERVLNCARAGAIATGTKVSINYEKGNDNKLIVPLLSDMLLEEAVAAGAGQVMEPEKELGSTDFGNVSHRLPSATLKVAFVPVGTPGHTRAWTEASKSERARAAIAVASKAMAVTADRLLADRGLLTRIRKEFEEVKSKEG